MAGEAISWKSPGGTTYVFDGSSNYLAVVDSQSGELGNYAPPVVLIDQRTPLRPGTTIRYQDIQPRIVTYPLQVTAASETALRTAVRTLVSAFMTTSAGNPGTLIATAPDGSQRQNTSAYYYDGLEGDGTYPKRVPGGILFPLQIMLPDPFWYDTTAITSTTNGPFNPSVNIPITNSGDYLVWPKYTITGPGGVAIENQNFSIPGNPRFNLPSLNLLSTDTLVIDTFAGTLTLNGVTNEVSAADLQTVLFPLVPGINNMFFFMGSGSTAASSVKIQYTNRWFSC